MVVVRSLLTMAYYMCVSVCVLVRVCVYVKLLAVVRGVLGGVTAGGDCLCLRLSLA